MTGRPCRGLARARSLADRPRGSSPCSAPRARRRSTARWTYHTRTARLLWRTGSRAPPGLCCPRPTALGRVWPQTSSSHPGYRASARSSALLRPGEEPAMSKLEREVGDEAQDAYYEYAHHDRVGLEIALGLHDAVPEAGGGRHELRDHQVRPGPAERDPQRVEDGGGRRRKHDLAQYRAFFETEGVAHVDELTGHALDVIHHQQDLLEEGPDEDNEELLAVIYTDPQYREGHERHRGHVADQVHRGLERRLGHLVCPHEYPEGYRHGGRYEEPYGDPVKRGGRIAPQYPCPGQLDRPGEDGARGRQEQRVDEPPVGENAPGDRQGQY